LKQNKKYILNNQTLNADLIIFILQKNKSKLTEFAIDISEFIGEEKE